MTYCDTCGKKLPIGSGYKTIDTNGNPVIICDECKQMMERKPLPPTTNYEDKWFNSNSKDSKSSERPKDVKWVVIAQFIGFMISPAIFIPFFTSYIPNESVTLYGVVTLVILALTSIGLMRGEKWSLTVTKFLQLSFIISWLIVVLIFLVSGFPFGLQWFIFSLVPLVILGTINKPGFKKFFKDRKTKFSKKIMTFLSFGVIFVIVFNLFPLSLFALEMKENPLDFGSDINLDREAAKEVLVGTWQNDNETVKLQFFENKTCILFLNNVGYWGEWSFNHPMMNDEIKIKVREKNGSLFYSDWVSVNYDEMKMKIENPFSDLGNDITLKKPIKEVYLPVFEILVLIIGVIGVITMVLSYKKIREVIKIS